MDTYRFDGDGFKDVVEDQDEVEGRCSPCRCFRWKVQSNLNRPFTNKYRNMQKKKTMRHS